MVYFSATLSTIIKPGWQRTKQGELMMMMTMMMIMMMIMLTMLIMMITMLMVLIMMIKPCQPSPKRLAEDKTR